MWKEQTVKGFVRHCEGLLTLFGLNGETAHFHLFYILSLGFPSSSAGKESTCNPVQFLGQEDPLEKG